MLTVLFVIGVVWFVCVLFAALQSSSASTDLQHRSAKNLVYRDRWMIM